MKSTDLFIIIKKEDKTKQIVSFSGKDIKGAVNLFNNSNYSDALIIFNKILPQMSDNIVLKLYIGRSYLELGEYKKSKEILENILSDFSNKKRNSKNKKNIAETYKSLGDLYMRQKYYNKAEEYFKKYIEIDDNNHIVAYNIGEMMFCAGKSQEAIKYYKLSIKIKPDWAKAYRQIGYAYLNVGNTIKSIEMFTRSLKYDNLSNDAQTIREVIKSLVR